MAIALLTACQSNTITTKPETLEPLQPEQSQTKSPVHASLIEHLTKTMQQAIAKGVKPSDFQTGSDRFNGEWAAGTYQMAVLGMGQRILKNPELKPTLLPLMETAVTRLLTPELNQFGSEAWGEAGLTTLDSNQGHAYLGYTNLALSMLRLIEPQNQFADVSDRLTQALARRAAASPNAILETYPDEAYPVDHAAVLASIALHDRALGSTKHEQFLQSQVQHFAAHFVDGDSGLVYQAVDATSGVATDSPRASGTALTIYFLSLMEREDSLELAEQLFEAIATRQTTQMMGLTGILEYPAGITGSGDVDSGELIDGISPSATVFAIAGAQIFQASELTQALIQSIQFFRNPPSFLTDQFPASITTHFAGPLDEALLLAMLTSHSHATRMPIE